VELLVPCGLSSQFGGWCDKLRKLYVSLKNSTPKIIIKWTPKKKTRTHTRMTSTVTSYYPINIPLAPNKNIFEFLWLMYL
jgi:hypothetical protein